VRAGRREISVDGGGVVIRSVRLREEKGSGAVRRQPCLLGGALRAVRRRPRVWCPRVLGGHGLACRAAIPRAQQRSRVVAGR
jgi:hypothetical protein